MDASNNFAWRTAISRKAKSRPLKLTEHILLKKGKDSSILDYGCGRGSDAEFLIQDGFKNTFKYDPYHFPDQSVLRGRYDTVLCFFVINVIPDEEDRIVLISNIRRLLKKDGTCIFGIRGDVGNISGMPYKNGFLTSTGSYQRGYTEKDFPEIVAEMNKGGIEVTSIYLNNHTLIVEGKELSYESSFFAPR